jgi:hypothetical protein
MQILTETVGGTVTYTVACSAPGSATVNVSTTVLWSWPPVTATVSASQKSTEGDSAVRSSETSEDEEGHDLAA